MRKILPLLFAVLLLPTTGSAYDEGMEYMEISPPQPTDSGDKVEVVEMFYYGCPHCYRIEPVIEPWIKKLPDDVEFKRVPAIFQAGWEPLARAYYTAEVLGVLDRIHAPLFTAIHAKREKVFTEPAIREFFVEQGVDPEDFDNAFHSFAVENKVRRAKDLTKRYQIGGVPSFVVNGKYRTNGTYAGGLREVPKVLDFLIEQEKAATAKVPASP